MSTANTLQSIFDDIYIGDKWHGGSGPGSFKSNTVEYVTFVNDLIRELGVKSFLDVGCGDWQLASQFDLSGIKYKGIDISVKAVELARTRAPEGTDISTDDVESVTDIYDFVHIKDVLQHLPNDECVRVLSAVSKHKAVLIVNDHSDSNTDIQAGQYRPFNALFWPKAKLLKMFNIGGFNKSAILIA